MEVTTFVDLCQSSISPHDVNEERASFGPTKVTSHRDLRVYQHAYRLSMEIFELSNDFAVEETYSITSQIRRSSRSICANLAEGWRKRHYLAAFVAKLSNCEAEAAETQV